MDVEQGPRRRQRRKEARPSEIIDAGLSLFSEHGFAGTRLEDVAKRAGIAKGTVYLYFPSKEALFEAAVKERIVSNMDAMGQLVASFEGTTAELLRRFFETIYTHMMEGDAGILMRILIGEGARFPHLIELHRKIAMQRGLETMKAMLKRAEARGELRIPAEDIDPRMIVAPLALFAIAKDIFPRDSIGTREDFIRRHCDLMLNGMLAR
ncbi:TetR/AcrR family transcriptional regulator [Rhizobium sp. SL86]|uniref:TetR/AcrR family transcriptional regulator n=1 Tax=Rhizobium sp. SL86 TaxID=2995148 RepID=UPI0022757197|nr:TetR/AcrR family transcriptional regulator [Rhizobium sp. SL86]MCY1668165.1 TetR/AcrR family transcriptional regulator [Rhizobium sp. SL86]